MKKLIFLIGISGSGKSTYIKSHFIPEIVVSPDDLRRKLSGSVSDQSQNANVWAMVPDLLRKSLDRYGKAVLDATSVDAGDRQKLLDKFTDEDIEKVAIIFDINPEEAKRRVNADIAAGVDRSSVPEYVIDRQYEKFKSGYNTIKQQFDKVIRSNSGGVSMKKEDIEKIKKLAKEEMKMITEEDAKQAMERAQYQTYQDMYLTPQSNWKLKQNTTMYDSKGRVYKGKVGEIHKIQTVEYDFVHTGEVITECGNETYSIDADDFRKAFEMVNDEQNVQVNNEAIEKKQVKFIPPNKKITMSNYYHGDYEKTFDRYKVALTTLNGAWYILVYDMLIQKKTVLEKKFGVNDVKSAIKLYNMLNSDDDIKKYLLPNQSIKEDIKKLSKIKNYFGKNIKESIERLEKALLNEFEYEDSGGLQQDPEEEDPYHQTKWTRVIPKFYYNDDFEEIDLLILIYNDNNTSVMITSDRDNPDSKVLSFELATGKIIDIKIPTIEFDIAAHRALENGLVDYDNEGNERYFFLTDKGLKFCKDHNLQNGLRGVLDSIKEIQD